MEVVLKDVEQASADKGKAYSEKILSKAVERGKMDEEKKAEILDRITATAEADDFAGCDLVIEAVFEDPSLKAQVFGEIQDVVNPDALLCSNTSTLPITELAEGVNRPDDFIGLHFFCPVDKMPLVEIIRGEKTSDEAVARALDVVMQIRKTPIVVNDSRGFYTSRVIGTMVNEGLAMLGEGVHPMSVERAATQAGYPVGTLAALRRAEHGADGQDPQGHRGRGAGDGYRAAPRRAPWSTKMIEEGRPGQACAAPGFYDYDENGGRSSLWPGLQELFPPNAEPADIDDLKDRYLFIEALETAKCFEEGVIESAAAANIGSIMGIGYPPLTGGTVQFMQGYDGRTGRGLTGFVARAERARREVRRALRAHRPARRDGREGRVLPRLSLRRTPPTDIPERAGRCNLEPEGEVRLTGPVPRAPGETGQLRNSDSHVRPVRNNGRRGGRQRRPDPGRDPGAVGPVRGRGRRARHRPERRTPAGDRPARPQRRRQVHHHAGAGRA